MTEATASAPGDLVTVCAAGHGRATWAMGSLFETLVTAGQTGGSLDAAVVTQPPGLATPLHVHTREAEAWFVLDGTLTYRAGEQLVNLGGGDFIYLPRDVPHAFRITGDRPARYFVVAVPGQVLDLYNQVGTAAPERRLPDGGIPPADIARWLELAPAYGLRVVGPPIPEPGTA
ncbi:MAG: cupin domain-containing protein [Actinomycetota bacterium]|nr:cupin domain-containing protein [Actinomycetota bacterium]